MMKVLMRKEIFEQWRTFKLGISVAVFLVVGLMSPLVARYTPELLAAIPDAPAELVAMFPEPTMRDAVGQYVKNMSQFGILLVIVLNMGAIVQEKERGTAGMLLTKPVRRSAWVIAKWLGGATALLVGLTAAALAGAFYTTLLFEPLPLAGFAALNGLMALFFLVYLTLAVFFSALARSQAMAAAGSFGGLALLLILGAIPRLGSYLPGRLLEWGGALSLEIPAPAAWGAVAVALALVALALALACLRVEREEL